MFYFFQSFDYERTFIPAISSVLYIRYLFILFLIFCVQITYEKNTSFNLYICLFQSKIYFF